MCRIDGCILLGNCFRVNGVLRPALIVVTGACSLREVPDMNCCLVLDVVRTWLSTLPTVLLSRAILEDRLVV